MNVQKLKGYAIGAVAGTTYGLNPLFALPLMAAGFSASSVLIFRYLLAIPILYLICRARGASLRVPAAEHRRLMVFGLMVGFSSVFLFQAYRFMDAGIASTILFVYPLMVAVMLAAFYHERISRLTMLCLGAALTGIVLLYRGEGGQTLSAMGTLLSVLSGLTYAIYIVGVRKSRLSRLPALTVTFYVVLYGIAACFLALFFEPHMALSVPSSLMQWACVAGLALFTTALSFLATTRAITLIGSTPTAILGALEPLTAVVVGVTVFHEALTLRLVCGMLLILGAVTLTVASPLLRLHTKMPRR